MKLPITYGNDASNQKKDSYLLALEQAFNEYLKEIKNNDNSLEVKELCGNIVNSYKQWCCGDCKQALDTLRDVLEKAINRNKLKIGFKELVLQLNSGIEFLYKARISDPNNLELKKDDMLHIPLNRRYLVQNQRFSIAGCPCIYMCNNSYACWTELGKPEFSKFYVSAIKMTQKNKMQLLNLYDDGTEYSENRLFVFPLIIATSFKNYDNNRKFKPEYVISSMIMILLSDLNCDGVIYSSNCIVHGTNVLNMNIAIPVKSEKVDECFSVGTPHNFRDFEQIDDLERYKRIKRLLKENIDFKYIQIDGIPIPYFGSNFSLFDKYISGNM